MLSFITKSAKRSNSVGSLLIITNLAPVSLAYKGIVAAGKTTKEDPATINKSD